MQTAHNFMNVAKLSKSQIIGDLLIDLGALYRLAAPSTPAEVVAKVVARGREGVAITHAIITEASAARRTTYAAVVRMHTLTADRREAEAPVLRNVDFSPRPASEIRTVRLDASHIPFGAASISVRLDDEFAAAQRLVIGMEVYDRSTTEAKTAKLARAATELGRDREAIRRVAEIIIAALDAKVRH